MSAPTPVTVATTEELSRTTPSSIPDALNKLPQFSNSLSPSKSASNFSNAPIHGNVLNLRGLTTMTDAFVVASGTSDTHVRGVADHVLEEMAKRGLSPAAVDGLVQGRWVVLDFVDFVVHVFHPTMRAFYQLERLWGDAPVLALPR